MGSHRRDHTLMRARRLRSWNLKKRNGWGIPVLAFLKELSYDDTDRASDDAKKRDKFRETIRDYAGGYFTSQGFKLASDLANKVGEAIINMLSNNFAPAPKLRAVLNQRTSMPAS